MASRLTIDEQKKLAWVEKHRKNIERRNSILKGVAAFAVFAFMAIGIAGYANYYMLLEIPNAPIAQFFSELGLLSVVFMIDMGVVKVAHYGTDDAALAVALAAVTAWATAVPLALAAAVVALLVAWATAAAVVAVWLESWKG